MGLVFSLLWILLLRQINSRSQVIDRIYYRGEWSVDPSHSIFGFSPALKGGLLDCKLTNDTDIGTVSGFSLVLGQCGLSGGDEFFVASMTGVFRDPSLYLYFYSREIDSDIVSRGNPVIYAFSEGNPTSLPLFEDAEAESAFTQLMDAHIEKDPNKLRFDFSVEDLYVYRTVGALEVEVVGQVSEELLDAYLDVRMDIDLIVSLSGDVVGVTKVCSKVPFSMSLKTHPPQVTLFEMSLYGILMSAGFIVSLVSVVYQMEESSTPALASRVSMPSLAFLCLVDAMQCFYHFSLCFRFGRVAFSILVGVTFLAMIQFYTFDYRFYFNVWKSANPPPQARAQWQAYRKKMAWVAFQFWASFFVVLMLFYQFPESYKLMFFVLGGFWIPQIITSIWKNVGKVFSPMFVLAASFTKMMMIGYFFLRDRNFLFVSIDPMYVLGLLLFLGTQATFVLLQYYLGARFFVPGCCRPKRYEYRRAIPEDANRNCVICMDDVEEDSLEAVITPCGHVFHYQCLCRWLEVKLECPVCRMALPYLEEEA